MLGGYRFLGRAVIVAAQARGHYVSAFNRGSLAPLPEVDQITGDRSELMLPEKRRWDVVIDTSGHVPSHARIAAERLSDRIDHYVYTSSISVYPDPIAPGADETTPLADFAKVADLENAREIETYPARKAASEAALAEIDYERLTIVRPGFIVGPYDNSDRFNSWVERAARAQPLIVPGDPAAPMQLIDVRDLAAWMVLLAERRIAGAFNATGPAQPIPLRDVAQTCIDATGGTGPLLPVASGDLKAAGVVPWEHIPFWFEPEDYGLMQVSVARALANGLRLRPLVETARDTYAWLRASDRAERRILPAELEAAAISRFRAR